MIELRSIYKSYRRGSEDIPVLRDVNLTIAKHEFVALMGPSGSGKSTLLNVIGCLDRFDRGSFIFNGTDVTTLNDANLTRLRNEQMGFVFQLFNLIPRISAQRNVELPMLYRGLPYRERYRRAEAALERVGLTKRAEHKPAELSGGQQQRVAIARALVNDPHVIIADEPTGNLDTRTGDDILGMFQRLHRQGATILLVTHEPAIAETAERVVYLQDGKIIDS